MKEIVAKYVIKCKKINFSQLSPNRSENHITYVIMDNVICYVIMDNMICYHVQIK